MLSSLASSQQLLPGFVASGPVCRISGKGESRGLSLHDRTCLYADKLARPSLAARALAFSSYDFWRNNPREQADGFGGLGRRVSIFYAREAAESTGALLAGALNREDPRFHSSGQSGIWNRTKAALLGTIFNQSPDSRIHLALAPIAGAFGAGFTGMALFPMRNRVREGLLWTGCSYGGSLGTGLMKEFRPDLVNLWARHRHRDTRLLSTSNP
jgi:hypothetical protein